MQGPKIDQPSSVLSVSPLPSSSSSSPTQSVSGTAPIERTRSQESFDRAKNSVLGSSSSSAPLDTEQDRSELRSSLSSSSSGDILRNSQRFPFIGETSSEVAGPSSSTPSSSASSSSSSSISPSVAVPSDSSSGSASSSVVEDPVVSRMAAALAPRTTIRAQLQQIDLHLNKLTKEGQGGSPLVGELMAQKDRLKIALSQRTPLKQEIMDEIVTEDIKAMPNSFEKAQAVFDSFMARGTGLYQYYVSGQSAGLPFGGDLLAGDQQGHCGYFAKALSECLQEAGFQQADGKSAAGSYNLKKSPESQTPLAFLTQPLDHQFIDPSARGNVQSSSSSSSSDPPRQYVFSQHTVTRLDGVGFFCPTTGKSSHDEAGLQAQLVAQPLTLLPGTQTYRDPHGATFELVGTTARQEGLYRQHPPN